jgi:hypothetical protein
MKENYCIFIFSINSNQQNYLCIMEILKILRSFEDKHNISVKSGIDSFLCKPMYNLFLSS